MTFPADPADLKAFYPEFSTVMDATVQLYLDFADEEIATEYWGTRAVYGEVALAAHMMVMAGVLAPPGTTGTGSVVGGLQSTRVGDVSVGYGTSAAMAVQIQGLDPSLAMTRYGLEYARLVKSLALGAVVV